MVYRLAHLGWLVDGRMHGCVVLQALSEGLLMLLAEGSGGGGLEPATKISGAGHAVPLRLLSLLSSVPLSVPPPCL